MKYGRVGLIVARLQGKTVRVPKSLRKHQKKRGNTIIGDKSAKFRWRWPKSDSLHEIVLQSSSQCLPLVRYSRKSLRKLLKNRNSDASILHIANSLMAVLNEIFNDPEATKPASVPLPLSTAVVATYLLPSSAPSPDRTSRLAIQHSGQRHNALCPE